MTLEAFRESLAAAGIDAQVEAHGRVAVIIAAVTLDAVSRRRIVAAARANGFSNVALELLPDENLSGD